MSDCFKINELLIPGTRQNERLQKALNPAYVLPDERSAADLLVFISKYASLINYYTVKGTDQKNYAIDGNWKPIIMADESFNYASISVTPYTLPNVSFYKYVALYETGSTTARRHAAFRVLWDILFSVYADINSFYTALPVYMQLRSVIQTEISNNLVSDFSLAAGAYLNDFSAIPSVNLQVATSPADDEYKFGYANDIINSFFDKIWIDTSLAPLANEWKDYTAVLNPNPALAQQFFNSIALAPSEQDMIDYSTLQLKQIFKRAFETYARIIATANEYLQNSLQNNPAHYAHHGLMLAFVKLFGILQTDINEFTRKHLEYYYNRVLQINPAVAEPDTAHIVFEPAKNISTHLIKKNTALNAGKDATGKLLIYNTNDEIVINRSKVEQLKTLFLKPDVSSVAVPRTVDKLYASPIANSADGNGAAFTGDDLSWEAFGDIRKDIEGISETNIANLGFYIASPVLHLTEGNRIVEIVFTTDAAGIVKANTFTVTNLLKLFSFSFSGEKKWEPLIIEEAGVTDFNCQFTYLSPVSANAFKMQLTLLPQCKALVGYDAGVCDGNLNTIYPVIKFSLNQNSSVINAYQKFRDIKISKIGITTTVSEITDLSLQNDFGAVDASKPILPFGSNPKKGSAFYIGHPELAYKQLTALEITLKWLDYDSDLKSKYYQYKRKILPAPTSGSLFETLYYVIITNNNSFTAQLDLIRNKSWQTVSPDKSIFEDGETTILNYTVPLLQNSLTEPENYTTETLSLSPQTQNGFLRFSLKTPAEAFGHSKWAKVFAEQTVAYTQDAINNSIPNPPYTPTLENIKLKYTATQEIKLEGTYKIEQGQFFHLMPFGFKEVNHSATLVSNFELEKKETDGTFNFKPIESALFIGISNTEIKQNISLLIQVNEGSENIAVDTPAINWNYLGAAGWKNLDKSLLADTTENLLKSGIVTFSVPVDAIENSSEFPEGFIWLMAAIEPDMLAPIQTASEGLPKITAVFTNAVKAIFANNANDPEHLAAALPANTISKFFDSDAAVKKLIQPFTSFGGKKIEEGTKFYTRLSERLRHKNRAITIWDYERLVLNEFQEVYMVKCLNHTGYETDCGTAIKKYKENIPGQVMLVPVPFITNLQTGNIYQPTLSAAKLTDIKNFIHGADNAGTCNKYIKALHCQLATLLIENPKYETIKVSCRIKVKQCLDANFYKAQLGEDLHLFLSPWIKGDEEKMKFGGRLHVSQVVYFIEQLYYIDYLDNITIEQNDETGILNASEPTLATATTSKSVLTSVGNDPVTHNPLHSIILL